MKYEFYLHDSTLMYDCKTEEKKNKYESNLKAKNVKYTLVVLETEVCSKCGSDDIKGRSGSKVCFKCGHTF